MLDLPLIARTVLDAYGNRITDNCGCDECEAADRSLENDAVEALRKLELERS